MIEQEQKDVEPEKPPTWRFVVVHAAHPDCRPIVENWPIPRIGDYVELFGPSPFWHEGSDKPEYIEIAGYVTAVKHIFNTQELPNGEWRVFNETRVLLEDKSDF